MSDFSTTRVVIIAKKICRLITSRQLGRMSLVHARSLGAHLCCLRYPWQPFPRGPLAELSYFSINLVQIGKVALGGQDNSGRASCFAAAYWVTLSGGTNFTHINVMNTLARRPEMRWLKLFRELMCFRSAEKLIRGQMLQLTTPCKRSIKFS